jgi:hypothetical protein
MLTFHMNFLETSQFLSAEELSKAADSLQLVFPKEFSELYLRFNGGYPEHDTFLWKTGEQTTINTFSSIKYKGFDCLEETYRDLVMVEKYLPVGIIPFATDDGGNFFCISARLYDNGSVYYCNNDHYDLQNKESCLTHVDDSYLHFVENLK